MSIPYGKQTISKADIRAVMNALSSEFLTTGPKVNEFEEAFATFVNAKYAVAVSNGTAALHLACLATGLKSGEELITSPMTFAASANCALYCGAKPIFVDIREENGLIDERLIEKKITSKTRIVIPVHYGGLPCNLAKIHSIAKRHKLVVIEDACHALGSKYKGTKIGDCSYSDMAVFSFHPVKHITTGEGGMITTNSKLFYEKLLILRTHGITRDPSKLLNKSEGQWYYEMQDLGFNYRITDFQCALGISQLSKVKEYIGKRISLAKTYDNAFSNIKDIEVIIPPKGINNAYHLYIIKVKDKKTRLNLFNYMNRKGIYCQIHYIPVYWHPYYQKLGYKKGICPRAEEFYERIVSIPMFPSLTIIGQKKVITSIRTFVIKNNKQYMKTLKIREAGYEDLMFLYNLKNDLEVRRSSFDPHQVKIETHRKWFKDKLHSKNRIIFIGEIGDKPVGQIRFDIERRYIAKVDISIVPDFRKNGYGKLLLSEGCKYIFARSEVETLVAQIKLSNIASQKLFSRCRFIKRRVINYKGYKCVEMIFTNKLKIGPAYEKIHIK